MKPNWFIGLVVHADGWFPERLGEVPPEHRLFSSEDLHLTVAFLGACGEKGARAAWANAADWPLPATRITLGSVVPMGSPRRYSALSALVDANREPTEDAIGAVRDAMCRSAGARHESRPPKVHLTLARPKRRASTEARTCALRWAAAVDLTGVELLLDRLSLYTWSEDRTWGLFRRVKTLGLARPIEATNRNGSR